MKVVAQVGILHGRIQDSHFRGSLLHSESSEMQFHHTPELNVL